MTTEGKKIFEAQNKEEGGKKKYLVSRPDGDRYKNGKISSLIPNAFKNAGIKEKIDEALANPDIYTNSDPEKFESLSKKRAEVDDAIIKAEALWLTAEENLDKARSLL